MKAIEMTIDNFPVTNHNKEAHDFVKRLVSDPEGQTIALLLGPANETIHLKHTILNQLASNVVAQTGSEFTKNLIEAIQNNTYHDFTKQYSSCNVYVLDDLQFFAGKEATQQAVYEIIKERFESGLPSVLIASEGFEALKGKLSGFLIELFALGEVIEITNE